MKRKSKLIAAVLGAVLALSPLSFSLCPEVSASGGNKCTSERDSTDINTPYGLINMKPYGHYRLTADIDLEGMLWKPISGFGGTLEGCGHTINGLESDTYGLFSSLKSGAHISNIRLTGVRIITDKQNIGAIVSNIGEEDEDILIEGCYVEGLIVSCRTENGLDRKSYAGAVAGLVNSPSAAIKDCFANAAVASEYAAGGIAGASSGIISGCGFGGELMHSFSLRGDIPARERLYAAGGIAGISYGIISGCSVTSDEICPAEYYGGITGMLQSNAEIISCVNSAEVFAEKGCFGGVIAGYAPKDALIDGCYSRKPRQGNVKNDVGKGDIRSVTYVVAAENYGNINCFKRLDGNLWEIYNGKPSLVSMREYVRIPYIPEYR